MLESENHLIGKDLGDHQIQSLAQVLPDCCVLQDMAGGLAGAGIAAQGRTPSMSIFPLVALQGTNLPG